MEKIDRAGRSSEVILRRDMSDIIVSLAADADDGFESAGAWWINICIAFLLEVAMGCFRF